MVAPFLYIVGSMLCMVSPLVGLLVMYRLLQGTGDGLMLAIVFTLTLANESMMKEIDYLGTVSGYKVPDKFERTGLKAEKSRHVDAPIIVGSPVVIECELIEFVETENFTTVLTRVVNMAADGSTHRIVRSVRQTSLIMIC
ncbi:MAG: flavin reductase [Candidatus Methanomethylophilaceae archaeon]|nr:flavin reductase [Candidatus Methanomethylophilaceae archaeon]